MKKKKVSRITAVIISAVMVLAMTPGLVFAENTVTEPVTAGFGEGQMQRVTVNGNVDVNDRTNAVFVEAYAPEEAEDKSASATVNGSVILKNNYDISAVYVEGRNGDASAKITGDISGTSIGNVNGIEAWGHTYGGNGEAKVTTGGNVLAQSSASNASGISTYYASVNVKGDVTAKGIEVYGAESYYDDNLTIGGNVKSEGETSTGMYAYSDKKTEIDVKGDISSKGYNAKGLQLETSENHTDPGSPDGLSINVGNGINATMTGTDPEEWHGAEGISFHNDGGKLVANINGNVEAKAANGNAIGIRTDHSGGETGNQFGNGSSEIFVHGNVISDGIGVALDTFGENTYVNVLVENEIRAKKVGVTVGRTWFAEEGSETEPKLTVWKINLNDKGNIVEWGDIGFDYIEDDEEGRQLKEKTIANFEKHIMYIAKVEQPAEGGTLKAVDANGNDLTSSFNFPVAHEGDKVILKADLKSGWKIKAAYNGLGADKQKLSKDENGNYYIIVPKGGGINLSADLEKEAAPAKTVSGTLLAKMVSKGSKGFTFGWTKVEGAEGYDVFLGRCDSKEKKSSCKKVRTINGNKIFKWTKKGLKKGKAYKAYVKAWIMKDGKKTYVKSSPLVHAYTNGGNKKFTNAKSVKVKKAKVALAKGKTFQIKASVSKLKPKKKLMSKGHAAKLRYLSSDTRIATVSKAGKIKARTKGSCKIYVYAVNGISKTVTVRVR